MVGFYTGLAAVAAMCIFWIQAPFSSPELIYPIAGHGLKQTIAMDKHFELILDRQGPRWLGSRPLPLGLLASVALAGLALSAFFRTRAGTALAISGANPRFAMLCGVDVVAQRRRAVVLSTALAALGAVVFSQSMGFVQLYTAPRDITLPTVASILIGGATMARATVAQAIAGVTLFQLLLVVSPPVVNDLVLRVAGGAEARGMEAAIKQVPESLRMFILNGFILYALTRRGKDSP
jgi:simple sugar transport system permease protein